MPHASVAFQVRTVVPVPAHAPAVNTSLNVTTGLGSQMSVTVGAGNTGVAGHWMGEVARGHVIVGGIVSTTTTVCEQLAELPQSSVAVHVLVLL